MDLFHSKLKILQWNCRSILNKKQELQTVAHQYDIILLIKTWLKLELKFYLKDFNVIRKDRPLNKGGGICICIRNNIKFTIEDSLQNIPLPFETLGIGINLPQNPLLIVTIYRPPNSRTT